jgi:hypothetical protein
VNVYRASLNPIVLVLDGYHLIEATAVHHTLSFLIDYQPAPLYLIIGARADRPLPEAEAQARTARSGGWREAATGHDVTAWAEAACSQVNHRVIMTVDNESSRGSLGFVSTSVRFADCRVRS